MIRELRICDHTSSHEFCRRTKLLPTKFDFGWICWVSSLPPASFESNSFIQLSVKEIFGGGRGRKNFLVHEFSRFHHDNFRDTISWEYVVKDDCVRSCLIELKSFLLRKFDVDPTHRVLMSFPLFLIVPCKTWCVQVNLIRIFVFLVHWIHNRKEYCPSFFAQFLSSWYQS